MVQIKRVVKVYWQSSKCCSKMDRDKFLGFVNCCWGLHLHHSSVSEYSRGYAGEQKCKNISLSLQFVTEDEDFSIKRQSWTFIEQGEEKVDGKKRRVNVWGPLNLFFLNGGDGNLKMWSGKRFGRAKRNSWEYTTQKQMTVQKGLEYEVALLLVV